MSISNGIKHAKTILRHKHLVMKGCFAVGLYSQGLLHDLSKFSPTEFKVGAKYFQGFRSPNNAEREDIGFSSSWLHHKGRNRHHFEYWIDYDFKQVSKNGLVAAKMPEKYVIEMVMDRIAASKVYAGKEYDDSHPYNYYMKGVGKMEFFLHEETRLLLVSLLEMLKDKGEKETFAFIKKNKGKLYTVVKKKMD